MSATANTGDHSGRIEFSDIGTSWEGTLTDRDLDEMMAAGEPVEGVVAAFDAGEKGVTARPDDKRQIVAWLVRAGFHEAAGALTEWDGPAPRSMAQRLQEARELVDWLHNYRVMSMVVNFQGVTGIRCARDSGEDHDPVIVPSPVGLTLDALFDAAAAHEIGVHGDR